MPIRLLRTIADRQVPDELDRDEVLWGYECLEREAPERAVKALASARAGHPGLAAALIAYLHSRPRG